MTSRGEVRRYFADQKRYRGGIYCAYCKEHKPKAALYRVYEMQHGDVIHACCPDCVEKAKASRVAKQWMRW